MTELIVAIYLETGFQKWCNVVRSWAKIGHIARDGMSPRAAFLGGAMYGQKWSGPASAKLTTTDPLPRTVRARVIARY